MEQPRDELNVVLVTDNVEGGVAKAIWDTEEFAMAADEIEAKTRGVPTGKVEGIFCCFWVSRICWVNSKFFNQFLDDELVVCFSSSEFLKDKREEYVFLFPLSI